jgi:hypothetical protein
MMLLGAGQTLRIEIEAVSDQQLRKLALRRKGDAQKEELHYPDASVPGVYELRASFTPSDRAKDDESARVWPGRSLTTPPVRIEIRK